MKHYIIITATILSAVFIGCSDNSSKTEAASETEQHVSVDNNNAAEPQFSDAATALPAFTVQDVMGNAVNLESLKGKKVFVNLWATWCPPCRREMPSIQKLSQSVDTGKVAFVMLSLDDNFEKAKAFVKKQKLSLPIYYPAENLPSLFNVRGIPTTFIFDERGNLMGRIDGGDDYDTDAYRKLLQ